jgi:hypothetical protein
MPSEGIFLWASAPLKKFSRCRSGLEFEMDYPSPPGTRAISATVIANGQSPGAKLWIDDFFIGR